MCHNVSFVINLSSLNNLNNFPANENGVWNHQGAPIAHVSIYKPAKIICCTKMQSHANCYKLSRTYHWHSSSPDFHYYTRWGYMCMCYYLKHKKFMHSLISFILAWSWFCCNNFSVCKAADVFRGSALCLGECYVQLINTSLLARFSIGKETHLRGRAYLGMSVI